MDGGGLEVARRRRAGEASPVTEGGERDSGVVFLGYIPKFHPRDKVRRAEAIQRLLDEKFPPDTPDTVALVSPSGGGVPGVQGEVVGAAEGGQEVPHLPAPLHRGAGGDQLHQTVQGAGGGGGHHHRGHALQGEEEGADTPVLQEEGVVLEVTSGTRKLPETDMFGYEWLAFLVFALAAALILAFVVWVVAEICQSSCTHGEAEN